MFVLDNLRELLDGHGGFLHGITFKQRADTVRDLLVAGGDGSSCHEKRYVFKTLEKNEEKKTLRFLVSFGWLVSVSAIFDEIWAVGKASENLILTFSFRTFVFIT